MIKTLTNLFKQDKEKFVVPKGVQDVIPVAAIFDDGIFKVGKDKYSKTYRFTDINYAVASREDKEAMFLEYSELLNSLDSGATTKITINNRRHQKLRFYPRIDCFFCGHTVVLHKAKCRKRGSTQNAHPRYGFRANIRSEQEIQSYRNATSENRKNELSERQSKKH